MIIILHWCMVHVLGLGIFSEWDFLGLGSFEPVTPKLATAIYLKEFFKTLIEMVKCIRHFKSIGYATKN